MTTHALADPDRGVNGWINLDKPPGLGSTSAVSRVRALLGARKAGHAGTLDPAASGVLPIALGEATKVIRFMQDASKTYRATLAFGAETSTDDADGEVVAATSARPNDAVIADVLTRFVGYVDQTPPRFSAIRVAGRRAHALARARTPFTLAPRRVRIDGVRVLGRPDAHHVDVEIVCGKGFYVRALARDVGRRAGTFAHLKTLRRSRVGTFTEKNATGLEKLTRLIHSAPRPSAPTAGECGADDFPLRPVSAGLIGVSEYVVDEDAARRLEHGADLPPSVAIGAAVGSVVVLTCAGRMIALGRVGDDKVRPVRVFAS